MTTHNAPDARPRCFCSHARCDPDKGCPVYTSEGGFCGCLGANHVAEMEREDHDQRTCLCYIGDPGDKCAHASAGPATRAERTRYAIRYTNRHNQTHVYHLTFARRSTADRHLAALIATGIAAHGHILPQ